MKLLVGLLLSFSAYVLAGAVLALAGEALWPGSLPVDGHPVEHAALAVDLGVQCIACFVAGACAMVPSGLRLRPVLAGVGLPLLAITGVTTLLTWSAMPDWYDATQLALTLPFFTLGAAWRHRAREASLASTIRGS